MQHNAIRTKMMNPTVMISSSMCSEWAPAELQKASGSLLVLYQAHLPVPVRPSSQIPSFPQTTLSSGFIGQGYHLLPKKSFTQVLQCSPLKFALHTQVKFGS